MLDSIGVQPFDRLESNARSYCRRFPTVFERANGEYLFDTSGRRHIDFLSCAGSVNYGHNNPVIKGALLSYLDREGPITALDLHTTAKRSFLEMFEARILMPRGLQYKLQFTNPTGTSVVESAVKLARKYTRRNNIVAFTNGFHGMSGVALSLTGNRYHRQPFQAGEVTRLPFDQYMHDDLDTIAYFRRLLTDKSSGLDLPAAIILETIQAEGGVKVASPEWLRAIRALADEHGILLIIDDIQVGCGRTGPFFSFERAGIVPDMICLSKSLSGIGLPLSVLLLKPELDVWNPGEDNGTFRGNNLAFVTATAALDEYWSDDALQNHVKHLEGIVASWLKNVKDEYGASIEAVRGCGLIHGIEFRDPALADDVARYCFGSGLIIETCGAEDQVVKILPPLTISDSVLRDGLMIISEALRVTVGATPPSYAHRN